MAESSPMLSRRTTKTRSVIFGGLRSKGHGNVAKALGISESTFSEWLEKYGDRIALMLTSIDHKPVPIENECHSPEYMASLLFFARRGMDRPPDPRDLEDE